MMPISTPATDGQTTVLDCDRADGERSSHEPSIHSGFPPMPSSSLTAIRPGIYQHFKGNQYFVIGVAPLVDSEELFVIYRPLYGDRQLVVRSYAEFVGTVTRDGRTQPRFVFVAPEKAADPASPHGILERLVDIVFRKRLGRFFR